MNDILESREERLNFIKQYLNDYDVVTLKANIPGFDKNIPEARLLINYYHHLMDGYVNSFYLTSYDGPTYYYLYNKGSINKSKLEKIESDLSIGRLIDLDLFQNESVSINRRTMRKCYLCDNPSFVCIRNRTHSLDELLAYVRKTTKDFFVKEIHSLIKESMMKELNLDPKFGLVTPTTSGSHKDMNYTIMYKSIDVVANGLTHMFMEAYLNKDIKEAFKQSRLIGIKTEEEMLKITNGINTYKGLIFILGCVLTVCGSKMNEEITKDDIFIGLKEMTKGISLELKNSNTYGAKAYLEYGIKGARGEVEDGLIHVKEVLNLFDLNDNLLNPLVYLISNVDDTVLLKRCKNILKYQEIKERFRSLNVNNIDEVKELNDYCTLNNLSFGGSADLLITAIFLDKYFKMFNIQ